MSSEIQETELPGIGRRFDLSSVDGSVSVVIHHSGRRDLYVREARARDDPVSLSLTDHQARQLGAILGGAYFKPAVVEEMEAVIGDLLIDWVTLTEGSPATGKSIAGPARATRYAANGAVLSAVCGNAVSTRL